MATISSHYVRAVLNGAQHRQQDIAPLIEFAGISSESVFALDGRVHEVQMARLIQAVWNTLDDEFMGCTSVPCKRGVFAMMCQLVSHCDTTDTMFMQGIKFYGLITSDILMQYRHVEGGREFVVGMSDSSYDNDNFYLEFLLLIWHHFISWMIGKKIKLKAMYFGYPEPAHSAEINYQFSCPCYFGVSETKLCFDTEYANLPSLRSQCELAQFLNVSNEYRISTPEHDGSIGLRVKTLLFNKFNNTKEFIEFEDLASAVCLHPQTLRRWLKKEGTSYQKIKDEIRCDMAIEIISAQKIPLIDMAEILGYSEPSAFNRAFKRWVGIAPGSFRRSVCINDLVAN